MIKYTYVGGDIEDIDYSIFKKYFPNRKIPPHSNTCELCNKKNLIYNYYIRDNNYDILKIICNNCKTKYINNNNLSYLKICKYCNKEFLTYDKLFLNKEFNNMCISCELMFYFRNTENNKTLYNEDYTCIFCNKKIINSIICNDCFIPIIKYFTCINCNKKTSLKNSLCNKCYQSKLFNLNISKYKDKLYKVDTIKYKEKLDNKNLGICNCGNSKPIKYLKCYKCFIG